MINVIRWMIPDIPKKLQEEIGREQYLTNELIMEQELQRSKEHQRWSSLVDKTRSPKNPLSDQDSNPLTDGLHQRPLRLPKLSTYPSTGNGEGTQMAEPV
jgi:hypothetical protein